MSLSCWMNSLEKQLVSEESPLCEVYSDRKRMAWLRQRDGGSGDAAEQSHVLLGDEGEIVRLAAVGGEERDERVLEVQRSFLVVGLLELLGVHETRHLVEDIAMNDAPALSRT